MPIAMLNNFVQIGLEKKINIADVKLDCLNKINESTRPKLLLKTPQRHHVFTFKCYLSINID